METLATAMEQFFDLSPERGPDLLILEHKMERLKKEYRKKEVVSKLLSDAADNFEDGLHKIREASKFANDIEEVGAGE